MQITPLCMEEATRVKVRGFSYKGNTLDMEYWCDSSTNGLGPDGDVSMYPTKVRIILTSSSLSSPLATSTTAQKQLQFVDGVNVYTLVLNEPVVINSSTAPVAVAGSVPRTYELIETTKRLL